MTECDLSTDELFLILYCIVDDLYPKAAPDRVRFRNGVDRMDLTDPEVITLSIMQEGRSNDSEFQRLGIEFPSGCQEGLSPSVSGSDLSVPVPS